MPVIKLNIVRHARVHYVFTRQIPYLSATLTTKLKDSIRSGLQILLPICLAIYRYVFLETFVVSKMCWSTMKPVNLCTWRQIYRPGSSHNTIIRHFLFNPAIALHGGVSYFAFVCLSVCLCVCVCPLAKYLKKYWTDQLRAPRVLKFCMFRPS